MLQFGTDFFFFIIIDLQPLNIYTSA
jgi:hypothetical protein